MKKRIFAGLVTATLVFGAVVGLAASLTVNGGSLGSGTDDVSSCDSDGVTTGFTYDEAGGVTAVVVSGIADSNATAGSGACDGRTVYVELLNASSVLLANAKGSSTITGDTNTTDDTVTITLGATAAAASVANARVTIAS